MKTLLAKTWRALSLPKSLQLFIMRRFQDQFLVGVTGIIFNEKNEVLLLKHTYRQTRWSLPGGYMKGKEHPEAGLAREIAEESGFIVTIDEHLEIKSDKDTSRLDICFIGTYKVGEFKKSAEVSEGGFFSVDHLPAISKNHQSLIREALKIKKSQTHTTFKTFFGTFRKFFKRR